MRPVTCTPSSLLYCESSGVFFQVNIFLNMLQPNLQAEEGTRKPHKSQGHWIKPSIIQCLKSCLVCLIFLFWQKKIWLPKCKSCTQIVTSMNHMTQLALKVSAFKSLVLPILHYTFILSDIKISGVTAHIPE